MVLQLGPGISLTEDAVTETFGILGQRGAGKSNATVVMAEEMWAAGLPWVAIDPKGDWWGLRSSADGKSPGLALPVFGGLHGDIPLEVGSGTFLADLVVDLNLTAVLDVSDLSKDGRAKFLTAFCDRLYRRHKADPSVRHLFLEEAHEYVPQMVGREEGRLKEAVARLMLQGRSWGIGVSVCSQRSARVHKDVLSQVTTLIAMRTAAKLDRKAIEDWVTEHDVARELVDSLPGLEPGEAWLWSPSYLGVTQRVRFRRRDTFDSGATPRVGHTARPPATIADVDLAAIKEAMGEAIERATADDPKTLRQRVSELERLLREARAAQPATITVEVPVIDRALVDQVGGLVAEGRTLLTALSAALDRVADQMAGTPPSPPKPAAPPPVTRAAVPDRPAPAPRTNHQDGTAWGQLGKAERVILGILAQHRAGRTRVQMALLSGYSIKSSSLSNALGALRSAGLVSRGGDPIQATDAGAALVDAAGDLEPLPTGRDLYEWWANRLGRAERAVLDVLVQAWPNAVPREDLAVLSGYSPTSSSLSNALGRLRSLELVDGWSASQALMDAIR